MSAGEIKKLSYSSGVTTAAPSISLPGGGGTSSGVNLCENPNGDQALDQSQTNGVGDWIDSGATSTVSSITSTSSEIPLSPLQDYAIKIAIGSSGTGYTRYRFTMPESLKNRKMGILWEQVVGIDYATGDLEVELYYNASSDYSGAYTEVALSSDVSGTTNIPAINGKFISTFDEGGNDYYELRIIRADNGGGANDYIALNAVEIGPGTTLQGAVVTQWESFTPSDPTNFTSSASEGFWRRVGENYEFQVRYVYASGSGAVTLAASSYLKSGLTIGLSSSETRQATNAQWIVLDSGASSTVNDLAGSCVMDNTGLLVPVGNAAGEEINTSTNIPITWAAGDVIAFQGSVPVSEWSGSGVVNYIKDDTRTDWVAYTPTVTNATVDNEYCFWRRVGDTIEVKGNFAMNGVSPVSGSITVDLPDGVNLDTTKMTRNADSGFLGLATALDINGVGYHTGQVQQNGTSTTSVAFTGDDGALSWNATVPFTFADNDEINFWFSAPITEWANSGNALVGFAMASDSAAGLVSPYVEGAGVVYAGTYTPTIDTTGNITGTPTAQQANYIRVGKIVHVSGRIDGIEVTTTGTDVYLQIELPVATSNFTTVNQVQGVASFNRNNTDHEGGWVSAKTSSQLADIRVEATGVGSSETGCWMSFSFSYEIQ